jgi:phospholipase/lecithinase/hemolysin
MKQFKLLAVAVGAALLVAACGGGSDPAPAAIVKPTTLVSFGDSLSDVGTYKVGVVAALGGGTYSVNGVTGAIPTKNWTELLAATMGTAAPCPAQTGLNSAAALGGPVAVVDNVACRNYAQGGARVTDTVGPGSASAPVNSALGQLTVPIVTQISNHLGRVGGSFSGTELVTVMAGGNDVLRLLDTLVANATAAGAAAGAAAGGQAFATTLVGLLAAGATDPAAAAGAIGAAIGALPAGTSSAVLVGTAVATAAAQPGNLAVGSASVYGPMVATATAAATTAGNAAGAAAGSAYAKTNGAAQAVFPMGVAGKELATYIKTQVVGKGAKYVAVVNLPDVSSTPSSTSQSADTQGLILNMVIYFNEVLAFELKDVPGVRVVDTFTDLRNQIKNPSAYGLTNVTLPACNLSATANGITGNGLADPTKPNSGTSLVCNATNTLKDSGGAFVDVSHYLFADTVHPTPYGYKLLADLVTANLRQAGWL